MARKVFTNLPHIRNDEPMAETGFYKWLVETYDSGREFSVSRFSTALEAFLKPLGFCMGDHFLSGDQLNNYKAVHDHFWLMKVRR